MENESHILLLEEIASRPQEMTVQQIYHLAELDFFRENLKVEKDFSWKKHWESLDKQRTAP